MFSFLLDTWLSRIYFPASHVASYGYAGYILILGCKFKDCIAAFKNLLHKIVCRHIFSCCLEQTSLLGPSVHWLPPRDAGMLRPRNLGSCGLCVEQSHHISGLLLPGFYVKGKYISIVNKPLLF